MRRTLAPLINVLFIASVVIIALSLGLLVASWV